MHQLQLTLTDGSGSAHIEWDGGEPDGVELIDLAHLVERQVREFRVGEDLDERIEELSLVPFGEADTASLSYLLGRDIAEAWVGELEATTDLNYSYETTDVSLEYRTDVIPYFVVTRNSDEANSRQLSKGELSALTLLWVLKSAVRNIVLLWDEPDAFLSPYSAEHALDLIVDAANTMKTPTVVSSHAFLSLAKAPPEAQVMLRLDQEGRTTLVKPDGYALWKTLRVSAPRHIAFVVEDLTAKAVLARLLVEMDYEFRELADIWIGGSFTEVNRAAEFPAIPASSLQIVGILDGDMRAKRRMSKHALYLPTAMSSRGKFATPEELALTELARDSSHLGASSDLISDVVSRHAGSNAHDKVEALATELGMQSAELVSRVTINWVRSSDDGRLAFQQFAEEVKQVQPRLNIRR